CFFTEARLLAKSSGPSIFLCSTEGYDVYRYGLSPGAMHTVQSVSNELGVPISEKKPSFL
ncbi:MAG: hypothetical protein O6932_09035, partial [Gammaproteobacteria bacterium]|nr:hypothetical protein [Gammaproteobacteria bacterium]